MKIKTTAMVLALILIASFVLPLMNVYAVASTNKISVSFRTGYKKEQGKVQYSLDDGTTWVDVEGNISNKSITVKGNNLKVKMVANENYEVDYSGIMYREDNIGYELNKQENGPIAGGLTGNNGYQVNNSVLAVELENVEFRSKQNTNNNDNNENQNENNGNRPVVVNNIDSVYFVWGTEGESGTFYYHKITGIISGGQMNYVPVSTIVADNDSSVKFNLNNRTRTATNEDGTTEIARSYEFVYVEDLDSIKDSEEFKNASTSKILRYLYESDMTINPIRALDGENCISTMGDLAFKLTIYNDGKYEGIEVGVPNDYEYYPSFWDGVFHWNTVDISGTTVDNPAVFEAFLLEKTIQINSNIVSKKIKSIKALNVPERAVSFENIENGIWNITYSSNYYDEIEFELTDVNNNKYYMTILRTNVRLVGYASNPEDSAVYAAVYYPASDSYKNYSIILTINYKDGSKETKIIKNPVKAIDDEGGNLIETYEYTGGENLKQSWYKLDGVERGQKSTVSSFNITVVKNYSTTSEIYGGTLSGADDGIKFVSNGHGFERLVGKE